MQYSKVRNFFIKRNKEIFKNHFDWNFKLFPNPYRKIKTVFLLEISAILLFIINKTNIKPNLVTIFGVFFVYLGTFLISSGSNELIYIGLFIYFIKLVPDYIDGALAYLKNLQSKDGHKLDLWAGEVNKLGVICGFMIYIFNTTLNYQFIYLLFFIILINLIDPRKYLNTSSNIIYDKNAKSHFSFQQKTKKNRIYSFLRFLNFDGRSSYCDFLIFLILIDLIDKKKNLLIIFPWIWAFLTFLVFSKSIFNVMKK